MRLVELSDGAHLSVRVQGAGPPIILLRPLGGTLALWGVFADILATRCTVIAYDTRGTGGSSPLTHPISTRRLARDAREVLDTIGVSKASVFGQSLGGMVATWLAVDAPTRVDRLVLASTARSGASFSHAGLFRGVRFARCLLERSRRVESCLARRVLSREFVARRPDRVRDITAVLEADPTPRGTLALLGLAGATHMIGARVSEIRAPALCLGGDLDALLGEDPQRALAASIPAARYASISGSGHDITLEEPEKTAERVLAFLGDP